MLCRLLLSRVDEALAVSDEALDPRLVAMVSGGSNNFVLDLSSPPCALSRFCQDELRLLSAERDNSFMPVCAYRRIAAFLSSRVGGFEARQRWLAVVIVAFNIARCHPTGWPDGGELLLRVAGFVAGGDCRRVVGELVRGIVDKGATREAMDGYLRCKLRRPDRWDLVIATVDGAIRRVVGGRLFGDGYRVRCVGHGDACMRSRFGSESAAYRCVALLACSLAAEFPVHFVDMKRMLVNVMLYWMASKIMSQHCRLEDGRNRSVFLCELTPQPVVLRYGRPFPVYDTEYYAWGARHFCSRIRAARS